MKKISLIIILTAILASCTGYKEFVQVQPRNYIPDGTMYLFVNADLETVQQAFNHAGIMTKSMDGGFETEGMLLDEGTRAMYKVHAFDDQVRVSSFYGITQKVKSSMVVYAGAAAASAYDVNAWDQVVYDKRMSRSKRVFDYSIQIIETAGLGFSFR